MAAAGKVVNQAIVYDEFEPYCKWQRKEDMDILEINLKEFKKEQLRVQISSHGILKIFGERELDASKHTKFYKEVPAPNHTYDTHVINAKFVNGILIITLPKLKISVPETNQNVPSSEPFKSDQAPKPGSTTTGAPEIGGVAKEAPTPGGHVSTECRYEGWKRKTMGLRMAKVAVSLAVTAAAAMVLVAYVVYMYKSTVNENDE